MEKNGKWTTSPRFFPLSSFFLELMCAPFAVVVPSDNDTDGDDDAEENSTPQYRATDSADMATMGWEGLLAVAECWFPGHSTRD